MGYFIGNTSGTAINPAYDRACKITAFSLANKTGGGITVSIGLVFGSTYDILYNSALSTATSYVYIGNPILVPAGASIIIVASGSCDYNVSID